MIKRLTLILLIALTAFAANAAVGSWKIHPIFGSTPSNAFDAGDKVYYLVSGNLYCYDKETSENIAYDRSNYLSDSQIANIYYNQAKNYLLIAYSNSNIDIILGDGKVVNIPDINNALLTSEKTINDVTFSGDAIYVATAFGYVKINDVKYEIDESRIYNVNIASAAKVGDTLLLASANGLYYGSASKQHSTLSSMSLATEYANTQLYPLEGNAFIQYSSGTTATYSATSDSGITRLANIGSGKPTTVQHVKSLGKVIAAYNSAQCYYAISADGTEVTRTSLPSAVAREIITSQESDGSWWSIGSDGLRKITISGNTASVVLDYQKINASTVSRPVHLTYNATDNYLFVSNTGKNAQYSTGSTTTLNTLSNSNWTVLNPEVTHTRRPSQKTLYNTYKVLIDPSDSKTFYLGSEYEGFFKFTNFEQVAHWDWTNSPLKDNQNYSCVASAYDFDKAGNLWMVQGDNLSDPFMVMMKNKQSSSTVTPTDWTTLDISLTTGWRQMLLITKKSDIKIYNSGNWGAPMYFIDDKGNPLGTITTQRYNYNRTLDQDMRNFTWYWVKCLTEDANGNVWVGCDQGVVQFDPVKCAASSEATVYRPKVPRNDGTNNADYLLDGVQVNAIAVDGMNRKWIGTENSGLYLVSADGTEIIEQFTSSNSILPSDKIISVLCNPTSNVVYVGTEGGLLEYESNSTVPAPSYDDVYVYPNPVRPDFTGEITIKGLMENSLVKISDASGNVVAQLQSNGGMATWDGCNSNGDRVKSGVYFVLASENENEQSNAVVAKFLIVR